jgi:hypothetical protein
MDLIPFGRVMAENKSLPNLGCWRTDMTSVKHVPCPERLA